MPDPTSTQLTVETGDIALYLIATTWIRKNLKRKPERVQALLDKLATDIISFKPGADHDPDDDDRDAARSWTRTLAEDKHAAITTLMSRAALRLVREQEVADAKLALASSQQDLFKRPESETHDRDPAA